MLRSLIAEDVQTMAEVCKVMIPSRIPEINFNHKVTEMVAQRCAFCAKRTYEPFPAAWRVVQC